MPEGRDPEVGFSSPGTRAGPRFGDRGGVGGHKGILGPRCTFRCANPRNTAETGGGGGRAHGHRCGETGGIHLEARKDSCHLGQARTQGVASPSHWRWLHWSQEPGPFGEEAPCFWGHTPSGVECGQSQQPVHNLLSTRFWEEQRDS